MTEFHIFFDDGGVMNDNSIRGLHWQKEVGEFFGKRFGGSPQDWSKANALALEFEMSYIDSPTKRFDFVDFEELREFLDYKWIEMMFDHMQLDIPENWNRVRREAQEYIIPRAVAPFEGIVDLIKQLPKEHLLHTASNEDSFFLFHTLKGMELLDLFEQPLFGVDILGVTKNDRNYYDRIFDLLNINPEQAIIVEDKPKVLRTALETGANVIQSCMTGEFLPVMGFSYKTAEELRTLLQIMTKER